MPHPTKPHWKLDKAKTTIGRAIDKDRSKRQQVHLDSIRSEKATGVKEGQAARSVLEQSSLDDFLAQAALSSTCSFEAERGVRYEEEGPRLVAVSSPTDPRAQEAAAAAAVEAVKAAARIVVPIPWRPEWTEDMNAEDLLTLEGEAFLDWRRGLAQIEQAEGVVMTPYERNLDFWRQLWRCVERSDLLVQIVDGRDPSFYRSRDLERYVRLRFGGAKRCLLLLNKADFMPVELRRRWRAHFAALGVDVVFFSALRELHRMRRVPGAAGSRAVGSRAAESLFAEAPAVEATEAADATEAAAQVDAAEVVAAAVETSAVVEGEEQAEPQLPPHGPLEGEDDADVVDCVALLDEIRARLNPERSSGGEESRKGVVGFVGYPNVGKSSVINALFGAKKVSMSRTPGKTKHLQTLELPGSELTLCDCPGLVFPSVVATKAHLAINGTVPIVELREFVQPVRIIVAKMGVAKVAAKYGLSAREMETGAEMLGQEGVDPARRVLAGFAAARHHFLRQKVPDETWAARRVLNDFCSGELLHCEPPMDHGEQGTGAAPDPAAVAAVDPAAALAVAAPQKFSPPARGGVPGEGEGSEGDDFADLDAFLKGEGAEATKGRGGQKQKGRRAR